MQDSGSRYRVAPCDLLRRHTPGPRAVLIDEGRPALEAVVDRLDGLALAGELGSPSNPRRPGSALLLLAVPEADTGAATILVDEFHARSFQGAAGQTPAVCEEMQPVYCKALNLKLQVKSRDIRAMIFDSRDAALGVKLNNSKEFGSLSTKRRLPWPAAAVIASFFRLPSICRSNTSSLKV